MATLNDALKPAVRRHVYRVLVALAAAAVLYGVLSAEEANVWLLVAANLVAVPVAGLASANVNKG